MVEMEAVIATGGKQYRVSPGQVITVEKVVGDKGSTVEFRDVVFVNRDGEVLTGTSTLHGARVRAEIVGQGRRRKVTVVKFKRRKNYRRHRGHRQPVTTLRITGIEV
jgi:large subunit ribosomal protein L21